MIKWLKRMLAPPFPPAQPGERMPFFLPRKLGGTIVSNETALQLSTYWRCVRVVSETIASLNWRVFKERKGGGQDIAEGNNVDRILSRFPNKSLTPFSFKELIVSHALTWGNGYAFIERDMQGRPTGLYPISPDRVTVEANSEWMKVYTIRAPDGQEYTYRGDEIFHLMNTSDNGVGGLSVAAIAARSLGLSLATEEYGTSFFANDAQPSGLLTHPGELTKEALDQMRASWERQHKGPDKGHRLAILEEGMTYTPMGLPNDDAQFLETRKFQVVEICRWFGVPPHLAYALERATFNNIEHQSREFAMTTILPWVTRLEQEANRKLIGQDVLFSKFNLKTLLRGDVKTQTDFYTEMNRIGAMNVNEIRDLEDMNPIGSDGDAYFIEMNRQPIERALEEPDPMMQPQPGMPPAQQPEEEDPEEGELSAMKGVFIDAVKRILRRERNIAIDMMKKNGDNQQAFLSEMAVQLAAKRERLMSDIEVPLRALGTMYGAPGGWWLSHVQTWFADAHTKDCLRKAEINGASLWKNDCGDSEIIGNKLFRLAVIATRAAKELDHGM